MGQPHVARIYHRWQSPLPLLVYSFSDLKYNITHYHTPSIDAPTGNGSGYYPGGTGWYCKQIKDTELKVNDGEGLWLHFEGVYHDGNLVPDAAIPVSLKVAGKANISVSSSAIDGIGSMTLRVE